MTSSAQNGAPSLATAPAGGSPAFVTHPPRNRHYVIAAGFGMAAVLLGNPCLGIAAGCEGDRAVGSAYRHEGFVVPTSTGNGLAAWIDEGRLWIQELSPELARLGEPTPVAAASGARGCAGPDGDVVLAWLHSIPYTDEPRLFAQRIGPGGLLLGNPATVNQVGLVQPHQGPFEFDLACTTGGGFAVVWTNGGVDGSGSGVRGRLFGATGIATSTEFGVNETVLGNQGSPAVTATADGGLATVWSSGCDPTYEIANSVCSGIPGDFGSSPDGSYSAVLGRLFDATGSPTGAEFIVNELSMGAQGSRGLDVSASSAGSLVVVWSTQAWSATSGSVPVSWDFDVAMRLFSPEGAALSRERRAAQHHAAWQFGPLVRHGPGGEFVVVWGSDGRDGFAPAYGEGPHESDTGVAGRLFGPDGSPQSQEFAFNGIIRRDQVPTDLQIGQDGTLVVTFVNSFAGGGSRFRWIATATPVCNDEPRTECCGVHEAELELRGANSPSSTSARQSLSANLSLGLSTRSALLPLWGIGSYAVCVYDGVGAAERLLLANVVPALPSCEGKPCWQAGDQRALFRQQGPGPGESNKLSLDIDRVGTGEASATVRRANLLPVPVAAIASIMRVQVATGNGTCWNAPVEAVARSDRALLARTP